MALGIVFTLGALEYVWDSAQQGTFSMSPSAVSVFSFPLSPPWLGGPCVSLPPAALSWWTKLIHSRHSHGLVLTTARFSTKSWLLTIKKDCHQGGLTSFASSLPLKMCTFLAREPRNEGDFSYHSQHCSKVHDNLFVWLSLGAAALCQGQLLSGEECSIFHLPSQLLWETPGCSPETCLVLSLTS